MSCVGCARPTRLLLERHLQALGSDIIFIELLGPMQDRFPHIEPTQARNLDMAKRSTPLKPVGTVRQHDKTVQIEVLLCPYE